MPNGKMVAAALIGMTVVAVLIGPLASTVSSNTGELEFEETATADFNNYEDLGDVYEITNNYTVETKGGTTLSEGTDYKLNQTDGTILAIDSTNVNAGDTLVVRGEYQATDSTTTTVAGLIPLFAALILIGVAAAKIRQMM